MVVVSTKMSHFALLKIFNFCLLAPSSACPTSKVFFRENTNLDEVSGLHGDRPPLPHAVREPGDVHHVHARQIGRAAVL